MKVKELRGLRASDRTPEEQEAINEVMGYENPDSIDLRSVQIQPSTTPQEPEVYTSPDSSSSSSFLKNALSWYRKAGRDYEDLMSEQYQLEQAYKGSLKDRQHYWGVDKPDSKTLGLDQYIEDISTNASSYYKKYQYTDKLPLTNNEKKELAAEYDARKSIYGEENADRWLDTYYKDKVGNNQSWWEQALNSISHMGSAIEGTAVTTAGMFYGALGHIFDYLDKPENPNLNWWDSFVDDVMDNSVTRLGRDIERSGASYVLQGYERLFDSNYESADERIAAMKASATKYNPEGIGAHDIITTSEQDENFFNSSSVWQGLQSGGFTAGSMLTGGLYGKIAGWLFGGLARGAVALNNSNRLIHTAEGLEKSLEGIKRLQNYTDMFVIPGLVGTTEGAMEGLSTKMEAMREGMDYLNDYYANKTKKEADELYTNDTLNPVIGQAADGTEIREQSYDDVLTGVQDKYKDEYDASRQQVEWASTKAGIHNFYANSLINGMMNSTLKAGLMTPKVQEALSNSRLFGWVYRKPGFTINTEGVVTPVVSKAGTIWHMLKEPLGEGFEEYMQNVSNETFSGAAENNINEFVQNKFDGDGTAKVTDTFSSDYAAALSSLTGSLTDKESLQSAMIGALSSSMGTVGGFKRGYHRDDNGNLVRNSVFDARNFQRGLNARGEQESWIEYAGRLTPWRSGFMSNLRKRQRDIDEAKETAETLTEWLKDENNRKKWDGLVGTANWMTQMEHAAESNDQFSYRKAEMGKAINDVFMLQQLKGTDLYETTLKDLQRASSMDMDSQEAQDLIQQIRNSNQEEYQDKTDEEILEKVQSNANKMLGLMTTVEHEGRRIDSLLGRIDDDTKQSLIFGKVMENDFRERKEQLQQEIDTIKGRIENSTSGNGAQIDDGLKKIILTYGSINKALKAQSNLQEQKEKLEKKIEELEKIDPEKTSDKQKQELANSRQQLSKTEQQLKGFDGLYKKDENGNRTDEIDAGLYNMVLSEQEIMDLDPVTRAMVMAQGANRFYNATHQDRKKIDQLNLEINEIDKQIAALESQKKKWTVNGKVKKGHNKQYQRNNQQIAELKKQKDTKMRALDVEQGKTDTKPIYNSAQQEVIDNLVQQGTAQDPDFLDKVVDMGRLEKGIKDYHTQYQAILSDPNAFHNYVQKARFNAQRDLTRRRAERIAGIQDFKEYSQELDKLTANANPMEAHDILKVLREKDMKDKAAQLSQMGEEKQAEQQLPKSNFDRYMDNVRQQGELVRQFAKDPNLTNNDQSLLLNAMQYLSSNGVELNNREEAIQALLEKDEAGNLGGKFREFVEAKNANLPEQQRAFMPQFTSIGQIVSQYADLLNGAVEDAVNQGNIQPTVTPVQQGQPSQGQQAPQPTVIPSPSPSAPSPEPETANNQPTQPAASGPTLFDIGGSTPDAGHFVDNNGTVSTSAQTQKARQRQAQQQQESREKTARQQSFETVTTPEIAQRVDTSSNLITNSNESDEVKNLALQYLDDIAVNNDEKLDTLDDILTAVQEQVGRLEEVANQQEKDDNDYKKAAGLLQKVYGSLYAQKKKGRRRVAPMPSSRQPAPKASVIHTANIFGMSQVNPDAWAVQFTDEHDIEIATLDLYEKGAITKDTPVYFIIDSDWTAEVTRQMTPTPEMLSINPKAKNYTSLNNMPIVAAVKVETPSNPAETTAIEVDGVWYQPIGVLPSSNANAQGAERTFDIRKLAVNREQGRHLVTENGLPNGNPLTTRVNGVNYLRAHYSGTESPQMRENNTENNTDVIDSILDDYLPKASADRLRAMSREQMLEDPEYREARNKVLNHLGWGLNPKYPDNLAITSRGNKEGEIGSPMLVFHKPMNKTKGRTDERLLPEVLESGTGEEVRAFNSRTQRLYDEVIRPIYQFLQNKDWYGDKSAIVITQEDLTANPNIYDEEAERLTKILNGYEDKMHGVSDFIYINPKSGWKLQVTAPEDLQVAGDNPNTSQTVYKVFFVNQDSSIPRIEIGTIRAGQKDTDAALELLRNIMYDATTGQVRDFLNWQLPVSDAQNLNNPNGSKARQNYAAIVDDGILEYAGDTLANNVDYVELKAPISTEGKIQYPSSQVANGVNAQPAAPQNVTPQGDGAVLTPKGQPIDPNSGANLDNNNKKPSSEPQESEKLKQAKKIKDRIIADSKEFTLSDDETHYYITDKNTGERIKYLRVTTVIGADESVPQWNPSTDDVLNKLKERHSISSDAYLTQYRDTQDMSEKLGIPAAEIRRTVAELRTEHKHEGYGAWSTPSGAIGTTVDTITRDFLAGHVKNSYPNITKEKLDAFVQQLTLFKADCDSKHIHIESEGVMAHGTITMTDEDGNTHDVKVAGTLDLFGYDDNGNFYIFDMKTVRNDSTKKMEDERAKWSRQISMYADLLKQSYSGFNISANNLRIIPINIGKYPAPMGRGNGLNPLGPVYSEIKEGERKGQLQMTYRGKDPVDFIGAEPKMKSVVADGTRNAQSVNNGLGQFQPGYTAFNINWDNLSSEDQDIADALVTQTNDAEHSAEQAPQDATIETPKPRRSSITPSAAFPDDYAQGTQEAAPQASPIIPNGQQATLPLWKDLTEEQKAALEAQLLISDFEEYNEYLNDPVMLEQIAQVLKCSGTM